MKANIKKYIKYTLISLLIIFWAYLDYNNYFDMIGTLLIHSDTDENLVKNKIEYDLHRRVHKNYSILNHQKERYEFRGIVPIGDSDTYSAQEIGNLNEPYVFIQLSEKLDDKYHSSLVSIDNDSQHKYNREDYFLTGDDFNIENQKTTLTRFRIGDYDYSIRISWDLLIGNKKIFLDDPIKKIDEVLDKTIVEWENDK